MKESIIYYSTTISLSISKLIPKSILYKISELSVDRLYNRNEKRRERIYEHLKIAFGNNESIDIDRVYNDFLAHLSSFYVEMLLMLTDRLDYNNAIVNKDEALSKITPLINRGDRGLILLVSHYGNWELLGHWLGINGLNGAVVARDFKNRLINENIIIPFRTKFGNASLDRKGALISISRLIKRGGGVALLIDQMIPPPNGIEIEFFGKKAYALKSVAGLKLKYDPLVVPVFAKRVGREKFEIIIEDTIEYKADEYDNLEDKLKAMTTLYTKHLEDRIKETPAQWQWAYRRWRIPRIKK